jgi:acetyl-CoA carboxylase alpha subunit
MEEKPRSTDEKMERRAGINRPSAYRKRRRRTQTLRYFQKKSY